MLHHGKVPRQRLAAMSSLWLLVLFLCPLRVASLNARSENRMLDILAETCKLDALMLAGTGEANKWGVSYDLNGRIIFSSGFTSTSMPNKSCGVSVFVGIAHPVEIQGNAKGGGLAQRIRSGRLDVTCIAAYFPPLPQRKADLPSYRATCREMMGLTSANGSWVQLDARQEFPGGAGEQLRIIPDLHGLSFFGNYCCSLIVQLSWSSALLDTTISAGPTVGLSKQLQIFRRRGLADQFEKTFGRDCDGYDNVHVGGNFVRKAPSSGAAEPRAARSRCAAGPRAAVAPPQQQVAMVAAGAPGQPTSTTLPHPPLLATAIQEPSAPTTPSVPTREAQGSTSGELRTAAAELFAFPVQPPDSTIELKIADEMPELVCALVANERVVKAWSLVSVHIGFTVSSILQKKESRSSGRGSSSGRQLNISSSHFDLVVSLSGMPSHLMFMQSERDQEQNSIFVSMSLS